MDVHRDSSSSTVKAKLNQSKSRVAVKVHCLRHSTVSLTVPSRKPNLSNIMEVSMSPSREHPTRRLIYTRVSNALSEINMS